jgi:hypothetical protein
MASSSLMREKIIVGRQLVMETLPFLSLQISQAADMTIEAIVFLGDL